MTKYMLLHIPSGECIIFPDEVVEEFKPFTFYKAMDYSCDNATDLCNFECESCQWNRLLNPTINRAEYLFEKVK